MVRESLTGLLGYSRLIGADTTQELISNYIRPFKTENYFLNRARTKLPKNTQTLLNDSSFKNTFSPIKMAAWKDILKCRSTRRIPISEIDITTTIFPEPCRYLIILKEFFLTEVIDLQSPQPGPTHFQYPDYLIHPYTQASNCHPDPDWQLQ